VIVLSTSSSSLKVISNMKISYVNLWKRDEKRSTMLNFPEISVAMRRELFSCFNAIRIMVDQDDMKEDEVCWKK